jgi:xylulose-5-phosphate/fructose-6-phosphate phosphoketolase
MGANPHANGGLLLRDLNLTDFRDYAVKVTTPGNAVGESTRILGNFLRDVMKLTLIRQKFRAVATEQGRRDRKPWASEHVV